jgi:hypothetical protein
LFPHFLTALLRPFIFIILECESSSLTKKEKKSQILLSSVTRNFKQFISLRYGWFKTFQETPFSVSQIHFPLYCLSSQSGVFHVAAKMASKSAKVKWPFILKLKVRKELCFSVSVHIETSKGVD